MSRSSGSRMFVAVAAMLLTGCHGKLLRENVLATTQTAIGLSVAQSSQTQMYEAKLGYFRSEFFLVPTSKRVVNDADNKDAAGTTTDACRINSLKQIENNDPSFTPEVLAEIQVGGTGKQAFREQSNKIEVYQRLAVGRVAVQSKAAVALMASDHQTAKALSAVPTNVSVAEPLAAALSSVASVLKEAAAKHSAASEALAALHQMAQQITPPTASEHRYMFDRGKKQILKEPMQVASRLGQNGRFRDFDNLAEHLQRVAESASSLKAALDQAKQPDSSGTVRERFGGEWSVDKISAAIEALEMQIRAIVLRVTTDPAYRSAVKTAYGIE
ncbi:MAG: hypothetical protein KF699_13215 [Phycisphaeraceae bacterium]|nr:hypothetical protein [Phycisphaeraceae bacterium]